MEPSHVLVDVFAEVHVRERLVDQRAVLLQLRLLLMVSMLVVLVVRVPRSIRAHLLSGALLLHRAPQIVAYNSLLAN